MTGTCLNAFHMPVTLLGIRIAAVNKTDKNPELMEAYILVGRKTINKINK